MADKYQYVDETGVIIADVADIKAEVQEEWKTAVGQDLVLDDDTPQGQLIDGETLQRRNTVVAIAQVANQINPGLSGGKWLDALCAWLLIEREPATRTLIPNCILGGTPNTTIPAGSKARTVDGDVILTVNAVRLNSAGTGATDCVCEEYGAISVPAGSVQRPLDTVLGWETISNPTAGEIGRNEESDASLKQSRYDRLARNNISACEAIVSALYDLKELQSLSFRENISDAESVIDGVTMKPHSIWVCCHGGSDADIGRILLREKTEGAGFNGSVTVDVTEPASGQTYQVQFERSTLVPIKIRVTASQGQSALDLATTIKGAIVDYAGGQIDGEKGFVTGVSVSPFEISGAIGIVEPGIFVHKVEVARTGGTFQTVELAMSVWELATISAANISVVEA